MVFQSTTVLWCSVGYSCQQALDSQLSLNLFASTCNYNTSHAEQSAKDVTAVFRAKRLTYGIGDDYVDKTRARFATLLVAVIDMDSYLCLHWSQSQDESRHLWYIPELRMVVTQINLFLLTLTLQPMISASSCPDSILPDAVADAEKRQTQDNALSAQVNRMANWIFRTVVLEVCPRCRLVTYSDKGCVRRERCLPCRNDTSQGPKCYDPSRSDCSNCRAGAVVEPPRQSSRTAWECTHSAEVHGHISDMLVTVPPEKGEASNSEESKACKVGASQSCLVRDECDENGDC